jgi:hypothetical protein
VALILQQKTGELRRKYRIGGNVFDLVLAIQ